MEDPNHPGNLVESIIRIHVIETPSSLPKPIFTVPTEYHAGGTEDPDIELTNAKAHSQAYVEYPTGKTLTEDITADGAHKIKLVDFIRTA